MSFRDVSRTTIPRIAANAIGSPRVETETTSSSYQIGVESLSLALTRHSVVVLKLRPEDADCLRQLQDAASEHFAGQQTPHTPACNGGHVVLLGCHSMEYRPGSPSSAALPHEVQRAAHQVL